MKRIILVAIAMSMLFAALGGCADKRTSKEVIDNYGQTDQNNVEADTGDVTTKLVNITYPEAIAFNDYEAQREVEQQNVVDESILNSISEFSIETASVILRDEDGNACYSPISLYMALAMLSTGAKGETQDELLSLLREDNADYLSQQMGKLFRLTYVDNKMAKLYMTNSLWMSGEVEFKQEFIDNAKSNFYAASNTLDFSDEKAGDAISKWISDNTNELLKPKIEVDPLDLVFIINTVYLKDEWENGFNENITKQDLFYTADGEQVNADFMTRELYCKNGRGDGFAAATLCLRSAGKMTFVLPDEGVDVRTLLESPESLASMIGNDYELSEALVSLPKFSFDTEFDLKADLKSLGVETVFADADLTGITDIPAYVSKVKQGSNISINEDGVEAAAYTYMEEPGSCPPEEEKLELNFNRPFIFIVQSNENVSLFIGVVQNPAQ